jgi:hypothetical protein
MDVSGFSDPLRVWLRLTQTVSMTVSVSMKPECFSEKHTDLWEEDYIQISQSKSILIMDSVTSTEALRWSVLGLRDGRVLYTLICFLSRGYFNLSSTCDSKICKYMNYFFIYMIRAIKYWTEIWVPTYGYPHSWGPPYGNSSTIPIVYSCEVGPHSCIQLVWY